MTRWSRWLPESRWKRWLVLLGLASALLMAGLVVVVATAYLALQSPAIQRRIQTAFLRRATRQYPEFPSNGPGLIPSYAGPLLRAELTRSPGELLRATNVWVVRLHFTAAGWHGLQPERVPPLPEVFRPDGRVNLRNPAAVRNGLAGALGFNQLWSQGDLEFGGLLLTNVAIRFKGNGTFVEARKTYKRPFKIDLDRLEPRRHLAGVTTLNLGNLVADPSFVADTLAYELYRDAGLIASRTAFTRVFLSIDGHATNRLLGLYAVVEDPGRAFVQEHWGDRRVAVYKPVTLELFQDLGDDWKAYDSIYAPKSQTTPEQNRRIIGLSKLVTHADDAAFGRRIGEFVDLNQFARWLAVEVTIANYDGFLSLGQNFLLYLDPATQKLGWLPWDLDHAWGQFGLMGTVETRENASIDHPWVGRHRFLERMLQAREFRDLYHAALQRLQDDVGRPDRLCARIDALAGVIRPAVREEGEGRLAAFEMAVGDGTFEDGPGTAQGLKRFITHRAESIREQLAGRRDGSIVEPARGWQGQRRRSTRAGAPSAQR